eukprot:snap_masked-scaffold_97-processed-gene-0.18-mRNA-1 protein AED:1.00 eAED:1.00 QI:0/-1/0/0/-1/1/1/0/136
MISANVYRLRSLLEKETVCHVSLMWWYEPPEYSPSEEVVKHFKRSYGTLSVKGIYDIKLTLEGYFLKTNWLRFEEDDSTFEPLEILVADVPLLVKNFLLEEGGNKKQLRKDAFEVFADIISGKNEALQLNAICFFL